MSFSTLNIHTQPQRMIELKSNLSRIVYAASSTTRSLLERYWQATYSTRYRWQLWILLVWLQEIGEAVWCWYPHKDWQKCGDKQAWHQETAAKNLETHQWLKLIQFISIIMLKWGARKMKPKDPAILEIFKGIKKSECERILWSRLKNQAVETTELICLWIHIPGVIPNTFVLMVPGSRDSVLTHLCTIFK